MGPESALDDRPDVVLPAGELLGWGDLPGFALPGIASTMSVGDLRNLARLAREGASFRQFHTAQPISRPARAAMRFCASSIPVRACFGAGTVDDLAIGGDGRLHAVTGRGVHAPDPVSDVAAAPWSGPLPPRRVRSPSRREARPTSMAFSFRMRASATRRSERRWCRRRHGPRDRACGLTLALGDPSGSTWGPCPACAADVDRSGLVDALDLAAVLAAWST